MILHVLEAQLNYLRNFRVYSGDKFLGYTIGHGSVQPIHITSHMLKYREISRQEDPVLRIVYDVHGTSVELACFNNYLTLRAL